MRFIMRIVFRCLTILTLVFLAATPIFSSAAAPLNESATPSIAFTPLRLEAESGQWEEMTLPAVQQGLLRMGEKDVISADIDDALILPPEKRPVLLVLQKIGFEQEHAGDDPAGDEGVIRPVDAIGHLLRAGADPRHKGEVGIGMAAEDIVQPFENLLPAYQLWKRPVQEIVGRGPGDDLTVAGPAARADGNPIGILPGELLQRSSRVPLLRPSDS